MLDDVTRDVRVPLCAAIGTLALLAVLVGKGPIQFLDAGSYAAGIESLSSGRGAGSELAPSFSHFTAVEFVERGGRIPFVDFPLGYPLVATPFAVVLGAKSAMIVVGLLASAALVAAVSWGPVGRGRTRPVLVVGAGAGLMITLLPMYQAVLRAGLSEPLFLAAAMLCLATALGGTSRSLSWSVAAAGLAGTLRFVGLPLVLVPTVLRWRLDGPRVAVGRCLLAVAPAAANVVWASSQGSGHQFGWRRPELVDLRLFTHSVTGWIDRGHGDFSSFFRSSSWPPWWGVALSVVWALAVLVAFTDLLRATGWLPQQVSYALAAAGLVAGGLFGGMLFFDSLVSADNRLMLPPGVLTVVGLLWWGLQRSWKITAVVVALWSVVAVAPWQLEIQPRPVSDADLSAAVEDVSVVVSDDADAVWWQTGVPAAYLPGPTRLLTGEPVDQAAEMARLPCLLHGRGGVIVMKGGPFAVTSVDGILAEMVRRGELVASSFGAVERFTPTGQGC